MNGFQADPTSLIELDDGRVSTIILNRPDRLNAVDATMTWALVEALERANANPETRAILLKGAGRAFCAGGDVRGLGTLRSGDRVRHRDLHLHAAFSRLHKPTVAFVHGAAIGLGMSIALRCDIVVAADDTRIGDPHVSLGLVAGDGALISLVAATGPRVAKELLLLPATLSGAEAAARGMIAEAWAPDRAEAKAYAVARQLAERSPLAMQMTKRLVRHVEERLLHEMLEPAMAVEQVSMALPDHASAVAAFQASRSGR